MGDSIEQVVGQALEREGFPEQSKFIDQIISKFSDRLSETQKEGQPPPLPGVSEEAQALHDTLGSFEARNDNDSSESGSLEEDTSMAA